MKLGLEPLQPELLCDSQQQQQGGMKPGEVGEGFGGVGESILSLGSLGSLVTAPFSPPRLHPSLYTSHCSASWVLRTKPLPPAPSSFSPSSWGRGTASVPATGETFNHSLLSMGD